MKNSREYSKLIEKLFRSLKQKYGKIKRPQHDEPVTGLVYAVLAEYMRGPEAKRAMSRIMKHFVDFNDLRVSRTEEILDVLGGEGADCKRVATSLSLVLNSVFNKYDTMSLSQLLEMGKRQARKELSELGGISRFVVDYFFSFVLQGHAIPLTEQMIGYLRAGEYVHPEATEDDIAGFLERQISAKNGGKFYALLRKEAESSRKSDISRDAGKTVKKPATKKKTAKKKTTKKKKKTAKKKTTRKKRS